MRVRKGIIIRALIYGPIIGYLSWAALCREPEPVQKDEFQVIELSPEEAEQMMGREIPTPAEAVEEAGEADEAKKAGEAEQADEVSEADPVDDNEVNHGAR